MDWSINLNWNYSGMKVGLFGGSFNPPHQGHLHISNLAIKKLGLKQIWWIPTAKNNFKDASIYEPYVGRYQKCQKITSGLSKVYIKNFDEIKTEKLVRNLKKRYPHYQFMWIMGADNFERFHQWDNYKRLIHLIPFAIFSRQNYDRKLVRTKAFKLYQKQRTQDKTLPKFLTLRTKKLDISSTQIRANEKLHCR